MLTQARMGAIGLRRFLFWRKVPEVLTPYCACGEEEETVEHLVVWCQRLPKPRTWPGWEISTQKDLYQALHGTSPRLRRLAKRIIGWLMDSGRPPEYSLARRLELEAVEDQASEAVGGL